MLDAVPAASGAAHWPAATLAAAAAASASTDFAAAVRARDAAAAAAASAAATADAASVVAATARSAAAAASFSCCAVGCGAPPGGTIVPGEKDGGGSGLGSGRSLTRRDVPTPEGAPVTGLPGPAVVPGPQVRSRARRAGGTARHRKRCGLNKRRPEGALPCEKGTFSCWLSLGSPRPPSLRYLYPQAPSLSPSKGTPLPPPPPRVRTRAAPSPCSACVSTAAQPAFARTAALHSPRSGHDDLGATPRTATSNRQAGASRRAATSAHQAHASVRSRRNGRDRPSAGTRTRVPRACWRVPQGRSGRLHARRSVGASALLRIYSQLRQVDSSALDAPRRLRAGARERVRVPLMGGTAPGDGTKSVAAAPLGRRRSYSRRQRQS